LLDARVWDRVMGADDVDGVDDEVRDGDDGAVIGTSDLLL
jgi:hypothetical protein